MSATANFLDFLKNVEDGNVFSDWKFDVKLKSVSTESYVRVNWDTPTSQLQNRNLKLRHRHFLSGADTGLRDLTWKVSYNVFPQLFCKPHSMVFSRSSIWMEWLPPHTI